MMNININVVIIDYILEEMFNEPKNCLYLLEECLSATENES